MNWRYLPLLAFGLLVGCGGGNESTPVTTPPPTVTTDFTPANPRLSKAALMADLQALASPALEGRWLGSAGNAAARAILVQRFKDLGLSSYNGAFEQPFTWGSATGTNVVGWLPGTKSGPALLLSAHFDHIGIRGGQVCPGADDNASGSAAVLQLAAYLKAHPPSHPVVFCLFDGEEAGLYGSQAFVAAPPLPLTQIGVVLNLDMIAQGTQGRIMVGGTSYTAGLKPYLLAAFATSNVKVVPDFEQYDAYSDQLPFMNRGVPFLFFCVGDDDPWYHTPQDSFERIPQDFYWATTEAALETVLRLDALDPLPVQAPPAPTARTIRPQGALPRPPWKPKRP